MDDIGKDDYNIRPRKNKTLGSPHLKKVKSKTKTVEEKKSEHNKSKRSEDAIGDSKVKKDNNIININF